MFTHTPPGDPPIPSSPSTLPTTLSSAPRPSPKVEIISRVLLHNHHKLPLHATSTSVAQKQVDAKYTSIYNADVNMFTAPVRQRIARS